MRCTGANNPSGGTEQDVSMRALTKSRGSCHATHSSHGPRDTCVKQKRANCEIAQY